MGCGLGGEGSLIFCHLLRSTSTETLWFINPFTASAYKSSGLKDTRTRLAAKSIISVIYVLVEVLSHVSAKKETETLKGFKFRIFIGHFQADSNGTGRAVKGLSTRERGGGWGGISSAMRDQGGEVNAGTPAPGNCKVLSDQSKFGRIPALLKSTETTQTFI